MSCLAQTNINANNIKANGTLTVTGVSTLNGGASFLSSALLTRDCRQDGTIDTTGAADSSATINTCIANAVSNTQGIVQVPCGSLKINTAINLTNRPGLTFQGCGMAQTQTPSTVANITYLICNTAGPCIDTTGSGQTTIRKMTLRLANSTSTPSTIGILEGRDNSLGGGAGRFCFAEHNLIEDLTIWSDTNTALNFSRGYIGIYNVAAELGLYSNVHLIGDTNIYIGATNDLLVTSPYQTLATGCAASMADTTIIDSSFSTVGFAAMEIRGALKLDLVNVDLLSNGTTSGLIPILFTGAASSGIRMNVVVESFNAPNGGALAIGANVSDISGEILIGAQTGTAAAAIIIQAGSLSLTNPNLRISYVQGSVNGYISSGVAFPISGGMLDISGTTSPLSQTNVTLTGTKIKAQGFTDANVAFNAASTYEIQTDAGVFEHQPATFAGQITSTLAPGTAPLVIASTTVVPNLNVQTIKGVTVSNAPTTGQALVATSASGASWQSVGGSFSCVNVTPVTVNANTAADQILQACSIPAGTLNTIGKTLSIQSAGVYSTPAASTTTVNLKVKLCTVSGCGSGTVITLASLTSAALSAIQATNDPFNVQMFSSTQTAGASAAFEAHGNLTIDISALTTAAEGTYADGNTATVGTIDSTGALFLQVTGAFSAASASNSMTHRMLTIESIN